MICTEFKYRLVGMLALELAITNDSSQEEDLTSGPIDYKSLEPHFERSLKACP